MGGGGGSSSGKIGSSGSSGKAGSGAAEQKIKTAPTETKVAKQSTTQEMKTQATQQPKSTTLEQNATDIALRKKNANAFDNITAAKLDKMTTKQLQALAKKAYVFMVGDNMGSPKTEAEAMRRWELLGGDQPKTSMKRMIMKAKKKSKEFK